jgi:translation initiation factor IF-1
MVKNTTGGSKHKGMARKLVNAPVSDKIRFSEDEDECYAKVTKMLGNGMCHVTLLHKDVIHENIVCHIRGKFRSRNKKSNLVAVGGVVLVGLRSWTSNLDACDLLCIYNDNQISSLNLPSSLLQNNHFSQPIDNDISFDNHISNSYFNNIDSTISFNDNDIDLDDI